MLEKCISPMVIDMSAISGYNSKNSLSFFYLHASLYNRNKMFLGFAKLWFTSPI